MVASQSLHASIINEGPGDAGQLTGTAQMVGVIGGGDTIQGTIEDASDVDLFGFSWGGGLLEINTFGAFVFDTQLHLFDSTGAGIGENDDSGGLQSQIALNLAAGDYFIGISPFNIDASGWSGG